MFRRRKKEQQVEGACTFCGFVPDEPSSVCPQCYYEFDKSPVTKARARTSVTKPTFWPSWKQNPRP